MTDYTIPTGDDGTLMIRDDGVNNVEFWIDGPSTLLVPEMPWAYTINGQMSSWQSFRFRANRAWQQIASVWVGASQTITLHLGDTGTSELGGPTNLSAYIQRGPAFGAARVFVEHEGKRAIPFVNVLGVWRQAEPWAKALGEWKQTS